MVIDSILILCLVYYFIICGAGNFFAGSNSSSAIFKSQGTGFVILKLCRSGFESGSGPIYCIVKNNLILLKFWLHP